MDSAVLPMQPATFRGVPVSITIQTRTGTIAARVWKLAVGPQHAAAPRFERRRQQPRGSRADGAPLRRRSSRPHPPGTAARRRRRAGLERHGHRARRHASERRAQRICGARARAPADGDRRDRCARGDPPGRAADRVHDAHAGAGRPRSLPGRAGRGASRAAARFARARLRRLPRSRPREPAGPRRRILHDGAGAETEPARERGVVAARPGLAIDVERAVSRPLGRSRADRPHHQRRARADVARAGNAAGLRTASRPGLDRNAPRHPVSGRRSTRSTTASCGKRIRR